MLYFGLALVLIGIILLAIAIVVLVIHQQNERSWWMWTLLVGGSILFLIGLALWGYGYYQEYYVTTTTTTQTLDTNMPSPMAKTRRTVHVEQTYQ